MRKTVAAFLAVLLLIPCVFMLRTEQVNAAGNGVEDFVIRLYDVCLDRSPDRFGLSDWANQLTTKQSTGISVAAGFIFSQEFQNKNCTDSEYVTYMYNAFFGREPDQNGFDYWVDQLTEGATREHVFAGFANSVEFYELCASFGVIRGDYFEGKDANTVAKVNLFVDRLYSIVLGRECDREGMTDWTAKLVSGQMTGSQVAAGFFMSPEYSAKNRSDGDFVEDLYNAMMGRGSDETGKARWIGRLDRGFSRESVYNGFVGSQEFAGICGSYDISVGSGIPTPASDLLIPDFDIPFRGNKIVSYDIDGVGVVYGCFVDMTDFNNCVSAHRSQLGLTTSFVEDEFVRLRAAETACVFSHTRPNGGDCFADGFYSEIIASSANGQAAFNLFMNSPRHKGIIENSGMPVFATASFIRCEWKNGAWVEVAEATCAQSHF